MSSRLLPKPPVARMTLFPLKVLCSLVRRLTAATPTIFPPEVSSPSTFVDQRKWIFGYRKHSRKSGPPAPTPCRVRNAVVAQSYQVAVRDRRTSHPGCSASRISTFLTAAHRDPPIAD